MTQESRHRTWLSLLGKIFLPLMFLAAGGAAAAYFQASKPQVPKIRPKPAVQLVETQAAQKGSANVMVATMGAVVPAQEISLEAEVSGTVVSMNENFVPGGVLRAGEEILRLDDRDYRIAVKKSKAALASVQADADIENGQQTVAREEYRIIKEMSPEGVNADLDLVLRKPYLAQVQADLESARADLEQARLDLDRTVVRAPFDCLVTSRDVNLGSYVTSQESLGELVGAKEYWIEAAVPVDRLALLDLNQKGGAPVRVVSQTGAGEWAGHAIRLTGSLTEQTRMAKVLVVVEDPLGIENGNPGPPLILGDYVQAFIEGRKVEDVFVLPRQALRVGDVVWVNHEGRLAERHVKTAWKDDANVFIASGLAPGERVVVSDISSPVPGMALSEVGDAPAGQGADQ